MLSPRRLGGAALREPLIWGPIFDTIICMKTTIDIADDLFERAQRLARDEKTTFRELTETGLRLVLSRKHHRHPSKLPPLVAFGGGGVNDEFKASAWGRIRDEIYKDRGA